jgi:hypothetical protein
VTRQHLSTIAGLRDDTERDLLAAALPQIAGYVLSFNALTLPPTEAGPPSKVTQPPTTLRGRRFACRLSISLEGVPSRVQDGWTAVSVGSEGLDIRGPGAIPERVLVTVGIQRSGMATLRILGTVKMVAPVEKAFKAEIAPFALNGDLAKAWTAFIRDAEKAQGTSEGA